MRRAANQPPSTPPPTPPQIPSPPFHISKIWTGSPPVSCCQLVTTEYSRAPMRPPTTAQNAIGTIVPAKPPNFTHRRCANHAATRTAMAMSSP